MMIAAIPNELSPRQHEIAALASSGLSDKEIARLLGLTEGSVKRHLHCAFAKLGIQRREHLILQSMRIRQS
jgi:DNA-binding CsgD family transcriptional regulator